MGMGITLQKIAKLANVSVSTASKALHGSKEVNAQTAAEVRELALRYGYFSSRKETTRKNQKSLAPKIAILCPEIVSIHYTELATQIVDRLKEKGASAQIFICDFGKANEWDSIRKCMESMEIDGAVGLFSDRFEQDIRLPFVCVGRSEKYSCVQWDIEDGIRQAVNAAVQKGYTRFAFLGETLTKIKEEQYTQALLRCGVALAQIRTVVSQKRFELAGYDAMRTLLEAGETQPVFCLCAYDEIAIGAMKALRESGLRVPRDVALMGINNIPAAEFSSPALSSVGFEKELLCEHAATAVLDAVTSPQGEIKKVVVPCRLYLRETFA